MRRRIAAAACAAVVALTPAVAHADTAPITETIPASGTFSFTTANGILPTWAAEDIVLVGIYPGEVITTSTDTSARVSLPVVAKTGTANATAGGFRLSNTVTRQGVRCSNPTVDTRARVVDCVLADGTNAALFAINSIRTRARVVDSSTTTTFFRDIELRINGRDMADKLNDVLDTTAFSPSVTVATGDLVVTRDR